MEFVTRQPYLPLFPVSHTDVKEILSCFGESYSSHGFRRATAISIRIYFYHTKNWSSRPQYSEVYLQRIEALFAWANAKEFFEYSVDFKAFLQRNWRLHGSTVAYLENGNSGVISFLKTFYSPAERSSLEAELKALIE